MSLRPACGAFFLLVKGRVGSEALLGQGQAAGLEKTGGLRGSIEGPSQLARKRNEWDE